MRRIFTFCMPTLLLSLASLGSLLLGLFYLPIAAQAQAGTSITSTPGAGSLGTTVTQNGNVYGITGGKTVETNLFHSFGQFGVASGDIAQFQTSDLTSNAAISNILGRVTGGNPSAIFGTIESATYYPSANLFLMNPAGFLFGPNATVNVGGMMHATTADYLKLADGNLFRATPDIAADAILTTSPVAAYGFLGSNPAAIAIQGSTLQVAEGKSLSFVGGNEGFTATDPDTGNPISVPGGITLTGAQLSAPGGQINLASVASPGEILTSALAQASNINGQSFGNLGDIQVIEQSVIDVSGNGGGTVLIRGGQFTLDNSTISASVTGPGPVTNGVETIGGGVDIQVSQNAAIQNFAVIDTSVVGNATPGVTYGGTQLKAAEVEVVDAGIISTVSPGSTGGNTGNITLEGDSILVKDSGTFFTLLQADTNGAGNSGNISLTSQQDLNLDNPFVTTFSFDSGNAGNINLTSMRGNISMVDTSHTAGSFVSSQTLESSSGLVGNITARAPSGDILLTDFGTLFTRIEGTGNNTGRGGIQVTANNLTMLDGSTLIGIDNFSAFQSGNLTLNLSGRLSMINLINPDFPNALSTTTRGAADAAALNITAHDIALLGNSRISTQTHSSGSGGPLNISTQTLELTKGAQITSGTVIGSQGIPSGNGGTVTIQGLNSSANSVLIDSAGSGFFTPVQSPGVGSGIFTDTQGTGTGGSINILANNLTVQNGGTLSAATSGTAPSASGGTITVNAAHLEVSSQGVITADTNGIAPAGVVDINTGTLTINSGGQIRSSSGAETEQVIAFALSSTAATPSLTGGTISIQGQNGNGSVADSVSIDGAGSGVFTQSTGSRPGGDINILTGQSVAMTNGANVSASSTGTGNAGNIQINAGNQLAMTNSTVTTEANQASGGAIKITTTPSGTVELTNSTISASVLDGTGGGGSVDIDPQFVILQNSQILANAVFGPGGNINITTNLLLQDTASVISASSQFGQQGTIFIQSPISPASGKILPLGQKPLIVTSLLSQRCAALAGGNVSSFTVAGRDSLPAEPGGWVPTPLALAALSAGTGQEETAEGLSGLSSSSGFSGSKHQTNQTDQINQTNQPIRSLRKIAPPGFLVRSFAVDSSDCQS